MMSSDGAGFVTEPTGAEVRATAADAARQARGVLAGLGDPDDELTATAANFGGCAANRETTAQRAGSPTLASTSPEGGHQGITDPLSLHPVIVAGR